MMKKYLSIIFVTLAIAGSSCKKDYLNQLTNNPNTPSVASPGLLLSGSLKTTAGILNGGISNVAGNFGYYTQYACWMGYLSWSTGFQANTALEQYLFTTSNYDVWTPLYGNISNYNALINAHAGANYTGIAQIMEVVDYQQLVDNYNNVPFSQALQGTKNLTPGYDKGPAIYDALMKQLDAAITLIQGAATTDANPGVSDIMFGGKMTNWLKYANTLKLRFALRVSTNPTLSSTFATYSAAVQATEPIGYLDSLTAAEVQPGYTNSDAFGGQQSPLWLNYGYSQAGGANTNNQEYQANQYSIKFFTDNTDPRLTRVYAPNPAGNVIGSIFGATVTYPAAGITPSKLGPGVLKSATMPAEVMSSTEAIFLQAEGVARGVLKKNTQTAAQLYYQGITSSFEFDGATTVLHGAKTTVGGVTTTAPDTTLTPSASAARYYKQSAIVFPADLPSQIQAIITQKWAALNPYGALEAYNEYRRTGYPNVPVSIYPGVTQTTQPTRVYYPFIEYSTNAANVAAQGTIDPFSSKIFWAK